MKYAAARADTLQKSLRDKMLRIKRPTAYETLHTYAR